MSIVAEQLDQRLRQLDPQTAARVERMVREILAITDPIPSSNGTPAGHTSAPLASLAGYAEPMGTMTNEEIDRAVSGLHSERIAGRLVLIGPRVVRQTEVEAILDDFP